MLTGKKFAAASLVLLACTAATTHAAVVTRNILKSFFQSGSKPTSEQFSTLIDSTLNLNDDHYVLSGIGTTTSSTGDVNATRIAYTDPPNPDRDVFGATTFSPVADYPMDPNWDGQYGFLPIEFLDSSSITHYGYVEISMSPLVAGDVNSGAIFVDSYSYETAPNTHISTTPSGVPEPATLSLLTLMIIPALRRRR